MKKEKKVIGFKWRMAPLHYLICIIAAFVIAILSFSGVLFKYSPTGRTIFGVIWVVIGIGWSLQYYYYYIKEVKKNVQKEKRKRR